MNAPNEEEEKQYCITVRNMKSLVYALPGQTKRILLSLVDNNEYPIHTTRHPKYDIELIRNWSIDITKLGDASICVDKDANDSELPWFGVAANDLTPLIWIDISYNAHLDDNWIMENAWDSSNVLLRRKLFDAFANIANQSMNLHSNNDLVCFHNCLIDRVIWWFYDCLI